MQTEVRGAVTIARLGDGENRVAPALIEGLAQVLDDMDRRQGPAALVTCGGDFYSNGYDLDWLRSQPVEAQRAFVADHERLRPDVLRDVVLGGERLDGPAALARGVVDEVAPADALLGRAVVRAEALAHKDRRTFSRMKQRLYGEVASALAPE